MQLKVKQYYTYVIVKTNKEWILILVHYSLSALFASQFLKI